MVTIHWLSEATGMHGATIRKRLSELTPDKAKYNSAKALEAIYLGQVISVDGAFIPRPEAERLLTIAKRQQIDLDMEIKNRTRIPLETVEAVNQEVCDAAFALIKSCRDKKMTEAKINEVAEQFRSIPRNLKW